MCVYVCVCLSECVCVCVCVIAIGFLMRWRWPCMTAICLHQQQHRSSSHSAYRLAHPGVDDAGSGVVRLIRVVGEATVHAHLA